MSISSSSLASRLDGLRADLRAMSSKAGNRSACLPFGIEAIDCRLAAGGLATGALHELAGASNSPNDDAAATLFGAGLAARALGKSGIVLWALRRRDLFAPAMAQAGLAPDRLIYAECDSDQDVLAVMEEGLRHGGLAVVVGEIARATMTATRRLQLVAEDKDTMALMLRCWRKGDEDLLAAPSAAATRWRNGCMPSRSFRRRVSPARAGESSWSASAAASLTIGSWRAQMKRVASLYLPDLPIDRLRRIDGSGRAPRCLIPGRWSPSIARDSGW